MKYVLILLIFIGCNYVEPRPTETEPTVIILDPTIVYSGFKIENSKKNYTN